MNNTYASQGPAGGNAGSWMGLAAMLLHADIGHLHFNQTPALIERDTMLVVLWAYVLRKDRIKRQEENQPLV